MAQMDKENLSKKKKTLIWFVKENKNGNQVPDHTKEQLDLHQSKFMLIGDQENNLEPFSRKGWKKVPYPC